MANPRPPSTPNKAQEVTSSGALSPHAHEYLAGSASANTARAVRADLRVYIRWGGTLPATEEMVANFLADQARHKKPSTVARYANSLHVWHRTSGAPSPVRSETVRRVLKGIHRYHDTRPASSQPLLLEDLKRLLDALRGPDPRSLRNLALISTAFFGAFRRSEVVALRVEDVATSEDGMIVSLRHSKANQAGKPETKAIARGPGGSPYCATQLMEAWLDVYTRHVGPIPNNGPVFPVMATEGSFGRSGLSGDYFYHLIKHGLRNAGLDPTAYSPHSLRSGLITSAYLAGKDPYKIKRLSGHRHHPTFEGYLRETDAFRENAADLLEASEENQ